MSTLLNRACNLPNTLEGKSSEVNHVTNALLANGYLPAIISNFFYKKKTSPKLIPLPEELVGLFFNLIENKSTAMACLPFLFVVSQSPSHVFFEKMQLSLLLDLTRLYRKYSYPPSLGLLLNFRPMWCIKSLVPIGPGVTLVKLKGVFQGGKRNTFMM